MKKLGQNKNCIACKKIFYVPNYRVQKAKFCSKYCLNHSQYKSIKKICLGCKNEFYVSNSRIRKKFCTFECKILISKTTTELRKSQKKWVRLNRPNSGRPMRKNLFLFRDKKCEMCGYDEYDFCLDIHHINENHNDNRIENLAILCVICHRAHHKGVKKYEPSKRL